MKCMDRYPQTGTAAKLGYFLVLYGNYSEGFYF